MIREQGILKVALLQFGATADKEANLAKARGLAHRAIKAGARFVVLPEVFNFRGNTHDKKVLWQAAEKIPGPSTLAFTQLAKEHHVSFLLGSILEKAPQAHVYNTSVFIDTTGKISAKYRKIHLFDARIGDKIIRESDRFKAGRSSVRVKVGDFRMGLSICYDLRFPEFYRGYSRQGVEILAAPSCFTKKTGEAHWETLLRARAIENLCYVIAPNQTGTDTRGIEAYGHSMVISPWGKIIARGSSDAEEIVFGAIDMEEIKKARAILPGIIKEGEYYA